MAGIEFFGFGENVLWGVLLGDGEVAVGLVHLGEKGVAGRNVAAVGRFVGPEDVKKDRVAAGPGSREQELEINQII